MLSPLPKTYPMPLVANRTDVNIAIFHLHLTAYEDASDVLQQ